MSVYFFSLNGAIFDPKAFIFEGICFPGTNVIGLHLAWQRGHFDQRIDSGGAGGARAPPEFGGSEKGRGLIFAYRSLAITTNTPGFKKLSTALNTND